MQQGEETIDEKQLQQNISVSASFVQLQPHAADLDAPVVTADLENVYNNLLNLSINLFISRLQEVQNIFHLSDRAFWDTLDRSLEAVGLGIVHDLAADSAEFAVARILLGPFRQQCQLFPGIGGERTDANYAQWLRSFFFNVRTE